MTVKLTWVHEPKYLTAPPPGTMMTTGSEIYAPLIRELERASGTEIAVVTGLLHEIAPADGVILFQPRLNLKTTLDGCASETRERLAFALYCSVHGFAVARNCACRTSSTVIEA